MFRRSIVLTGFEMVNICPEVDTERAVKYKKSLSLPDDTVVVFFHQIKDVTEKKKGGGIKINTIHVDEVWGHYYMKNRKAQRFIKANGPAHLRYRKCYRTDTLNHGSTHLIIARPVPRLTLPKK